MPDCFTRTRQNGGHRNYVKKTTSKHRKGNPLPSGQPLLRNIKRLYEYQVSLMCDVTTGRSISMSGTDPFNMQRRAFLRPLPGVRRGGLLSAGGRLGCCPPILSFQLNMIYFGKEKITTRTLGWVCFWVYAENESMALCLFIITYAAIRFPAPHQ